MKSNTDTKSKAIEWWETTIYDAAERVEWKIKLSHKYYGGWIYTNLTDEEIEYIYISEHAQTLKEQVLNMLDEAKELNSNIGNFGKSNTETDEGYTKGKWDIGNNGNSYQNNGGYETAILGNRSCLGFIWGETKEQSKANANRILQTVNGWDKLMCEKIAAIDVIKSDGEIIAQFAEKMIKLKATNDSLVSALTYLLSSYKADFKNITGSELNDTEAVIKAKQALNNINQI